MKTTAQGVPYPSRVEFCGDSYSSRRREWTDVRIVRRLQGSRHQERLAARNHFRAMRDSQRAGGSKPTPLFRLAMDNLRDAELVEECIRDCDTPEYLTCPLLGELMIDPVTIATGKTFDRQYLKDWFEKNGHICPVTGQPVSGAIVRNERIRRYLYEWERITKVSKEHEVNSRSSRNDSIVRHISLPVYIYVLCASRITLLLLFIFYWKYKQIITVSCA
ncbi:U-box domain-containing protein 9-like [Triticum aestivum]|uniref:U-box domain-containing protein 9-like n=1 Tax=Triticum aestivum TaxID=4565 RepID=UPI001D033B6E|nr:U-box domain-containing protein 9-like [Triticum aestivum]